MRIGVTGGIGSGKTYVCRLLAECLHCPVYDCDSEAKRLMNTSASLRRQLIDLVGPEAYSPEGNLNRKVMSDFLFTDINHVQAVNAIVHPTVKADLEVWAANHHGDIIVESAILIEAGMRDSIDMLIVVEAPVELRILRAMERDGTTLEQVMARMRHQLSYEALRPIADYIIINDGRNLDNDLHQIKKICNY